MFAGVCEGVRERFAVARAHDDAHGGEALRLQSVRPPVCAQRKPPPAHADPQRRQALRLRVLRPGLSAAKLVDDSSAHAHRRDALPLPPVRPAVQVTGPPQPPPKESPCNLNSSFEQLKVSVKLSYILHQRIA
jgi:hypothetical protein